MGSSYRKKPKPLIKSPEKEKEDRIPILRYYNVFHIQDVEGLESKKVKFEGNPVEEAERIIRGYDEVPMEHYDSSKAWYSPGLDKINVPEKTCFPVIEEYYSTAFHEMTHSTGHHSRLKRFEAGVGSSIFGSESYSFEELVAELGAAFLCGVCQIEQKTLDNSASYISHWLERLRGDNTFIVKAAGKAQKSADYITHKEETEIKEPEIKEAAEISA